MSYWNNGTGPAGGFDSFGSAGGPKQTMTRPGQSGGKPPVPSRTVETMSRPGGGPKQTMTRPGGSSPGMTRPSGLPTTGAGGPSTIDIDPATGQPVQESAGYQPEPAAQTSDAGGGGGGGGGGFFDMFSAGGGGADTAMTAAGDAQTRRFPWWWIVVGAVVLGGGVWYWRRRKRRSRGAR